MKRSYKIAASIVASLGLGLAITTAYAHPGGMGGMGGGMGPGMMRGMSGGNGPAGMGMGGGMGPGAMGGPAAGRMAAQQLMTPEEQTALRDKMSKATTPDERQKLAEANRTEMQKRAKEKGITLPEGRGPGMGFGPNAESHKH